MNYLAFESNDTEFNPLFEKMRERFCQNGTVAEQLSARAAKYKKQKPKRVTAEHHMTMANSLPKESSRAQAGTKKRSFFSLKSINSACMLLLIAGTVLFSGAAIGTIRGTTDNVTLLEKESAKPEDNMIVFDAMPWQDAASDSMLEELSFQL